MGTFRSEGNRIFMNDNYCEFLIPMEWFSDTKRFALDQGNRISLLGVCYLGIFKAGSDVPEIRTLNVPTWIVINVYESEVRQMKLPGYEDIIQVKVIKYYKGNDIMENSIFSDSSNVQSYLKLIIAGKLPGSISYNDSLGIWIKNQAMNDFAFSVPMVILEVLLSTSYRDPNNLEKKFASVYGKDANASPYAYTMINNRQICQYVSTFTAMTFEDFDTMVTTSINRTRKKVEETDSPLEKIIKM